MMPKKPPPPPPPDNSCNPVAGFNLFDAENVQNPSTVQPPETITCTNTSTGAVSYEWFVDGASVSTSQNLTHAIGTAACGNNVTVELRAYCEAGQTGAFDTFSRSVLAECEAACNPVAVIGRDWGDGEPTPVTDPITIFCGGLPANLVATLSSDALSYEWKIDGVTVGTAQTLSIDACAYTPATNTLTVELIAYCDPGQSGPSSTDTCTVEVEGA